MGSITKLSEEPMYDPQLLLEINKDDHFLLRPLRPSDYGTGFLELIGLLRPLEGVTEELFLKRFSEMKACPNTYYVTVIEDTRTQKVVATATLLKEQKFFHKCAERGRMQDVAVSEEYQGQKLGKMIVDAISHLAKHLGCYRVSLDCRDRVVPFYEKLGYHKMPDHKNFLQNFLGNQEQAQLST